MALRALLAAALLVLTAGCGDESAPRAEPEPEETTMTPLDARVSAAIDDLAAREDVDPRDVKVAEAQEVTWSDGSLGCPKPGMSYIQALTDGFLLVLEVDGRRFEYHGGRDGQLRLCESPSPPASTGY